MAKKTLTSNKKGTDPEDKLPWKLGKQYKILLGFIFLLFSVALLLAFISFFIYGQEDQSAVAELTNRSQNVNNWLGKFGAFLADLFIYKGFGIASFLFVKFFFLTGAFLVMDIPFKRLKSVWFWDLYSIIVISILCGFFATTLPELGGTIGYEMNLFMQDYVGSSGTFLILLLGIFIYLIFKIKISSEAIKGFFERSKKEIDSELTPVNQPVSDSTYNLEEYAVAEEEIEEPIIKPTSQFEINKEALKPTISSASEINMDPVLKSKIEEPIEDNFDDLEAITLPIDDTDSDFVIEKAHEEDIVEENLASRLVADFGLFDPTLELSNYQFPTLDLMKEYSTGGITINQEELEENKNKILETLRNYKI
jgi:S-DNA-T family DNA segregation ATPase FtsK/SpoIIIE